MAVKDENSISQKSIQDEAIRALEKLAGQTFGDDDITFEGQRFVLPERTTLLDAAQFLARKAKEWEEQSEFIRKYTFKPWDVAYNTVRAFKRVFGTVSHTGSMGFFGREAPRLVEVPDGPNSVVQVPIGEFRIPHLPDVVFEVGSMPDREWGMIGFVKATGPKRLGRAINAIFDVIAEELRDNSLYKGKAIVYGDMPTFIDVDKIKPERIVYAAEVQDALDTHVMARLEHPVALERLGINFRSKILLEGEFGVGKTEALNLVAKKSAEVEVTYIHVPKNDDTDLLDAMNLARMHAPAVVAFEDVDTLASASQEQERIAAVLDAFDGGQSKLNQVMVLITTNHVDTLHKGMVRPGRIDAIIHIEAPDAAGIQRIIEVNVPEAALDPDMRWAEVVKAMESYHPAFVVEAASRAMRYAVVRSARANGGEPDEQVVVSTQDLVSAGAELRRQWDLHQNASTEANLNPLDVALQEAIEPVLSETLESFGLRR